MSLSAPPLTPNLYLKFINLYKDSVMLLHKQEMHRQHQGVKRFDLEGTIEMSYGIDTYRGGKCRRRNTLCHVPSCHSQGIRGGRGDHYVLVP